MAEKSAISASAMPADTAGKESVHSIESKLESQTQVEVNTGRTKTSEAGDEVQDDDTRESWGVFRKLTHVLLKWGVETHGCVLYAHIYLPFLAADDNQMAFCVQNLAGAPFEAHR